MQGWDSVNSVGARLPMSTGLSTQSWFIHPHHRITSFFGGGLISAIPETAWSASA